MANNKINEMQTDNLKNAIQERLKDKPESGELSDDALDGVSGGAVLDSTFFIAKCNKCGWQSCPFDNRGADDLEMIVRDHCTRNMDCTGDFVVYEIDSRSVRFG